MRCSSVQCRLVKLCLESGDNAESLQYILQFTRTADMPSRQRLQSSITDSLSLPAARLSTVGRRAFPVTGVCIWNDLPSDITSSPSLLTF